MQTGVAEWVAPMVRRILAPNPSPMTGPGTNSYLVGRGDLALIDPGPLLPAHISALLAAVDQGERIAKIIVTHAHLDHSAAAPQMAALTGAPVLAFGGAGSGRSSTMQRLADAGMKGGGEGIDTAFRPDLRLADGTVVGMGGFDLRVIHTPGHMGGHICLSLGDVLFSGDHAMGWASSLISPPDGDMGAYMASLVRLMAQDWAVMLPGHGPEVTAPAARLCALHAHRKARETAILAALARGPASPRGLATQIYTDIPPTLIPAAHRNIIAHLIDLECKNKIRPLGQLAPDGLFTLHLPNP